MTALTDSERRTLILAASFSAVTVAAAFLYVRSQTRRLEGSAGRPERLRRAESSAKPVTQPEGDNVPRFDSALGWLRRNSTPSATEDGSPAGVLSDQSHRSEDAPGSHRSRRGAGRDGDQLSEGGSLPTEISKQSSTRQGSADPFGADSTFSGDWALQLKDLSFVKRPDGSDMLLGAGSYGNVYKAIKDGVTPVAVKVFPSNATDVQQEEFQREVVILKSCRDRNIVQFLGACVEAGQTFLVTEYMEGGDLFNALHKHNSSGLTWYRRDQAGKLGLGKRIALDIACGLNFLHTHRIVHMDVKSPNVLLGQNSIAKLADVGLAKFMHKDYLSAAKSVGTFAWSAPEVLMGGRCSEKVDIFSYGVVLWELCTGESPVRGRLRPVRVPAECPESVRDLIAACMDAEPGERPSAREIVEVLTSGDGKGLKQQKYPRRRRSTPEVGPCSGKVLDAIIRHASVLGVADYTRADALQAAALKDGLRLYKAYVAELSKVMPNQEAPPAGTPEHARLLELVASMRRLLAIFLAEHMTTMRELRKGCAPQSHNAAEEVLSVNTEKAAPEMSINSEGSTQDPTQVNTAPGSVIGKRETVSWRKAADCVRLTVAQAAAVAEARTMVGARLTELAEHRKHLIASLNAFTAGPGDGGDLDTAVNASEQLQQNMAEENSITHEFQFWFVGNVLTPEQEARLELVSMPYYPDTLAITDLILEDAKRALSKARIV